MLTHSEFSKRTRRGSNLHYQCIEAHAASPVRKTAGPDQQP